MHNIDHHDLKSDFPDHSKTIDTLKGHSHFSKIFQRYNKLTAEIENIETHDAPISDFTLEDLKKERVRLKDEIYHDLMAFESGKISL